MEPIGKLIKSKVKKNILITEKKQRELSIYRDEQGREFVKFKNQFWKYPEQIEC